ncbi:MAG: hypothetical protein HY240_07890 [Actinobacteria bacterium]|nr:hypothetical protein [Actinomycetota bacterium]
MTVHRLLYERFPPDRPGVSDIVEADDGHRGSLLSWLVWPYGIGLVQILELESTELAIRMNQAVNAIVLRSTPRQNHRRGLNLSAPAPCSMQLGARHPLYERVPQRNVPSDLMEI